MLYDEIMDDFVSVYTVQAIHSITNFSCKNCTNFARKSVYKIREKLLKHVERICGRIHAPVLHFKRKDVGKEAVVSLIICI